MEIQYPNFARGRILKIGMLENLRDFPRDAVDCFCETLSDGIVCGLSPIIREDTITFSKGILKHKGQPYVVSSLPKLNYGETDTEVAIKLLFKEEEQLLDYKTQAIDLIIDGRVQIKKDEIELGRFKLKKGAYLRTNYQDLYDFTTEYNTVNLVQVLYAGYGQPTLSCQIMKYFAKAAMDLNTQNHLDISFCLLCLNSDRMERDTILQYLMSRIDSQFANDPTNFDIHEQLVKALAVIKKESSPRRRPPNQKPKVLID